MQSASANHFWLPFAAFVSTTMRIHVEYICPHGRLTLCHTLNATCAVMSTLSIGLGSRASARSPKEQLDIMSPTGGRIKIIRRSTLQPPPIGERNQAWGRYDTVQEASRPYPFSVKHAHLSLRLQVANVPRCTRSHASTHTYTHTYSTAMQGVTLPSGS